MLFCQEQWRCSYREAHAEEGRIRLYPARSQVFMAVHASCMLKLSSQATGLADPGTVCFTLFARREVTKGKGPIASMFWQNEEFSSNLGAEIRLDGVVCVVDAVFALQACLESYPLVLSLTDANLANGGRYTVGRYQ
jgi:hypothetical protein